MTDASWLDAIFFRGRDVAWQDDAACRDSDADVWFPEKGQSTKDAKSICSCCLVRAECLEYALAGHEAFGVWGGASERERRRLRTVPDDDLRAA